MKWIKLILLMIAITVSVSHSVSASATLGSIDPDNSGNYIAEFRDLGSNTEINFGKFTTQSAYNISISDDGFRGYAWGEAVGWIVMSCEDTVSGCSATNGNFKVAVSDQGVLSGYAWGENTGWINFGPFTDSDISQVKIIDGAFKGTLGDVGYAWAQNHGWIEFDCSTTATGSCVLTDYEPSATRTSTTTYGYLIPSSPFYGILNDFCANIPGVQQVIPWGSNWLLGNCIAAILSPVVPNNPQQVPVTIPVIPSVIPPEDLIGEVPQIPITEAIVEIDEGQPNRGPAGAVVPHTMPQFDIFNPIQTFADLVDKYQKELFYVAFGLIVLIAIRKWR